MRIHGYDHITYVERICFFLLSWQYKRDVSLFVYRAMREFCFIRCTLCKCENTLRFGNVIARFTDTPTMTYRTVKFYSRLFAYDLSFVTFSFSLLSSPSSSSSSSSSFLPISLFREYFILVRMICRKSVSFSRKLVWINGIQHFPNQTMCWYVICRCPAILSWILLHVAQRMLFFLVNINIFMLPSNRYISFGYASKLRILGADSFYLIQSINHRKWSLFNMQIYILIQFNWISLPRALFQYVGKLLFDFSFKWKIISNWQKIKLHRNKIEALLTS